jgi:prevent-host-death family protein
MKSYSIAEAKNVLGRVVHEAEAGQRVEITRRGRPVAVVLSLTELAKLSGERRNFWSSYRDLRQRFDLEALGIDPTEVFGDAPDRSPGKDFSW